MAWNHRGASGGVHRNEGWILLAEGAVLAVMLTSIGLMGTSNIIGSSFMGWGAALAGLIFAGFVGMFYSVRPIAGRYDVAGAFMLLGVVFGVIIEYYYPFGSAILNASYGYNFLGMIVTFLVVLVSVAIAYFVLWAAERKEVY